MFQIILIEPHEGEHRIIGGKIIEFIAGVTQISY